MNVKIKSINIRKFALREQRPLGYIWEFVWSSNCAKCLSVVFITAPSFFDFAEFSSSNVRDEYFRFYFEWQCLKRKPGSVRVSSFSRVQRGELRRPTRSASDN